MPNTRSVRQIGMLREDLLRLGSMVEHAILNAVKSLEQWDSVAAAQIIADDKRIDEAQRHTELQVIKLIAARSYTDFDPYLLIAAFAIAGELERIGDYACRIARRVQRISRQPAIVPPLTGLGEMSLLAQQMLNTSLEAFLQQNVEMACSLSKDEKRVDILADRLQAELIAMARAEPQRLEAVVAMLDVIHVLERVADRATNIGERVIYLATNKTQELNP